MKRKEIIKDKQITPEVEIFIKKYRSWVYSFKRTHNKKASKKLGKILEDTSIAIKITFLRVYRPLAEVEVLQIIASIDWSLLSTRTRLYLLKSLYESGVLSGSMNGPELSPIMKAVNSMFGSLKNMRACIRIFNPELQLAILLMYAYENKSYHTESHAILKYVMEEPRFTSKMLFELGYYSLAGVKYCDEGRTSNTLFVADTFISEQGYSKDYLYKKVLRKINGREGYYSEYHTDRCKEYFSNAFYQRSNRKKYWEFISYIVV